MSGVLDSDTLSNNSTYTIIAGNNVYRSGLTSLGGSGNKTGIVTDYQAGALGNYYYPTNGTNLFTLINAGSRTSDLAGLYHFTLRVDQSPETNSLADIGYHYVAFDPEDGLVGWWKLDDGTGTNALDSSGLGNHGTLLNGPTWVSGILGGALSFDGSNDYVEVPYSASLNITSAVTLSAWISQDALVAGNKEIIFKGADALNTSSRVNYGLRATASGKIAFVYRDAADTIFPVYQTATAVIAAATTYHVAVVHTFGNGGATKIYLNGVSQSASWTQGTGNETPMTASKPLWLGSIQSSGVPVNYWNGDLDDVRVYNRALSATEIASLANAVVWDIDGDGWPDYLEDRNGNGVVDTGETDWHSSTDFGLKVWITEPKSNSNIP